MLCVARSHRAQWCLRLLNELEIAQDLYARGNRLGVAGTALGRIGLMIGADAFAPGEAVSRTLALMGADMILSPCAGPCRRNTTICTRLWRAMPALLRQRRPRARPVDREHGVWIAGASNVGPSLPVRGGATPASAARSWSGPTGSQGWRGHAAWTRTRCCSWTWSSALNSVELDPRSPIRDPRSAIPDPLVRPCPAPALIEHDPS